MNLRDSHKTDLPYYVQELSGEIVEMTTKEFLDKYKFGVIRIRADEFENIPQGKYFTHFNLSPCYHKLGSSYYIVKICGRKNTELYGDQPVLSMHDAVTYKCIQTEEDTNYLNFKKDHFTYSMSHMLNTQQLSENIVKRYRDFVSISTDELSCAPVSITQLERIK